MNKPCLLLPIAGKADRFKKVGIDTPKPLIEVGGKTIIEWSLKSIYQLHQYQIIFVIQEHEDEQYDLSEKLIAIYGNGCSFIRLKSYTGGALETCYTARQFIDPNTSLTIFTPDAMCLPAFSLNDVPLNYDGLLSLYPSVSPSCSYASLMSQRVVEVAEKQVISPYATTGLYHFKQAWTFFTAAEQMIRDDKRVKGEFYIAPLYNDLIERGFNIGYEMVSLVNVLGTPEELQKFKETHP